MPATNSKCPEKNTLFEFLTGKLPESDIQIVESHLQDCPPCGDTIRGLDAGDTSDDLLKRIKDADFEMEPAERSDVQAIIERLQSDRNLDVEIEADGTADSQPPNESFRENRAREVTLCLAESDNPEHLGKIAHYQVTQLLGSGGTGVVYKAIDTQLQRPVALKVLRPSLGNMARERFVSEAQTAARLDHDQVVTIYQVGEANGLAYMAMQWLPGETLEGLLRRSPMLSNEMARNIFRQIALGLAAAHEQGLIHRDIKPANIWIESETNRVKILDFGLARVADDDPKFTETGMIAGTPSFMSPEQARGNVVDHRSDLFSLGCVLYRMISGQLPFQAPNVLATLQSIQRFTPAEPVEWNESADTKLNQLAICLLEKNANRRPQSAVSVLHALETEPDKWPFSVPESINDDAVVKLHSDPTSNESEKPSPNSARNPVRQSRTQTGSGSRFVRWIALCAILFFGFGGWMYGNQIIRIVTGTGVIEIEANDPNIKIEVLQDGKTVKVIESESNQEIIIKEGQYELRAASAENQVEISPNELTLVRGGKQLVRVTIKTDALSSNSQPAPSQLNSSSSSAGTNGIGSTTEPTYDGKTIGYWLEKAKIERKPQRISEILVAIYTLMLDETSAQQAQPVALSMMSRVHLIPSLTSYLYILEKLPPDVVAKTLMQYIHSEDEHALANGIEILRTARHQNLLGSSINSPRFFATLLDKAEYKEASSPENSGQTAELYLALYNLTDGDSDISHQRGRIIRNLQRRLPVADTQELLTISEVLTQAVPNTEGLAVLLSNIIINAATYRDKKLAIRRIRRLGKHSEPALPILIQYMRQQLVENQPTSQDENLELETKIAGHFYNISGYASFPMNELKELADAIESTPAADTSRNKIRAILQQMIIQIESRGRMGGPGGGAGMGGGPGGGSSGPGGGGGNQADFSDDR